MFKLLFVPWVVFTFLVIGSMGYSQTNNLSKIEIWAKSPIPDFAGWVIANLSFRQIEKTVSIDLKASGVDNNGNEVAINPSWTSDDPSMIKLSSNEGSQVTLTVIKEGESALEASSDGISKKLLISAFNRDGFFHVYITQP